MSITDDNWIENNDDQGDIQISQYDITSTPNDFNVITIANYLESGSIVLPAFQRNFTWDRARASKLIESLLLGIPVPQTFLYEEKKNRFLILDGQQRLLSIYFFLKGRFPKSNKRVYLRDIIFDQGNIPDAVLHDDDVTEEFSLKLTSQDNSEPSPFSGKKYSTLGDDKTTLDMRPIRNVVIKQNEPKDDNSSIYEIYDRLNTGGVNLKSQEIRANLYRSTFYNSMYNMNRNDQWRRIINKNEGDVHMRDIELLLRSFALLVDSDNYRPSMTRFLNEFSNKAKVFDEEYITLLSSLFDRFMKASQALPDRTFFSKGSGKFSMGLFEAVFCAKCKPLLSEKDESTPIEIESEKIGTLIAREDFQDYLQEGTTKAKNVDNRLLIASEVM